MCIAVSSVRWCEAGEDGGGDVLCPSHQRWRRRMRVQRSRPIACHPGRQGLYFSVSALSLSLSPRRQRTPDAQLARELRVERHLDRLSTAEKCTKNGLWGINCTQKRDEVNYMYVCTSDPVTFSSLHYSGLLLRAANVGCCRGSPFRAVLLNGCGG
jgi:hypothetical protein